MNKLTKGSIAAAAAIALLLGGAGTFATWNASSAIAGANITAGNLSITAGAAGTWEYADGAAYAAGDRIVPGDEFTYTQEFQVTATGKNIAATLALTGGSIVAATPGNSADVALAGALSNSAVLSATGLALNGTGGYIVPVGTTSVTVTVTVTFPRGSGNSSMDGAVSLSNMNVTLTQN